MYKSTNRLLLSVAVSVFLMSSVSASAAVFSAERANEVSVDRVVKNDTSVVAFDGVPDVGVTWYATTEEDLSLGGDGSFEVGRTVYQRTDGSCYAKQTDVLGTNRMDMPNGPVDLYHLSTMRSETECPQ